MRMRVVVLKGGWSSEREISLRSAAFVSEELVKLGHDVYELDVIKKDLRYLTDKLYEFAPDFVFNVLHGVGGEDGVMQGVLEMFDVPYNSSRVLGSAIAFHKSICKSVVAAKGVNVIDGYDISSIEISDLNTPSGITMQYPFVVKPAENGSSVGVFLIFDDMDLLKLKNMNWSFGNDVIIERYIDGREFSVLVVDGNVIGVVEIVPKRGRFYDYESKYSTDGSVHVFDFDLDRDVLSSMHEMARIAFRECRCSGMARIDFKLDGRKVCFLEINTQPGMTKESLVPDIARFNGININRLFIRDENLN
jgi:D-alanine-D-alanine ligase